MGVVQYTQHQIIYRAMLQAHKQGEPIHLLTVTTYLDDSIKKIGGTSYLLELTEAVLHTKYMKRYEQLLIEAFQLRKSWESNMDPSV